VKRGEGPGGFLFYRFVLRQIRNALRGKIKFQKEGGREGSGESHTPQEKNRLLETEESQNKKKGENKGKRMASFGLIKLSAQTCLCGKTSRKGQSGTVL